MRLFLSCVTLIFCCTNVMAQASPSPREALAARLYQLMEQLAPADATSQIAKQAFGAFEGQACFKQMQPRIQEMVAKYAKTDFSKELAVMEYAKAFSAKELQGMIDFAMTPLGKKWFKTQPRVAAAAANAAMTHFQQHQMQIANETMAILQEFQGKDCQ